MKMTMEVSPPLHSQILVGLFLSVFLYTFPSTDCLDQVATQETFTRVLFPRYVSLHTLSCIRLLIAAIILTDSIDTVLYGSWVQDTDYLPQSNLKAISVKFAGILMRKDRSIWRGMLTLSSFTLLSWFLLGTTFLLMGLIPFMQMYGLQAPQWILRLALIMFECSAPVTMLISAVVKYALWPMALQSGKETNLKILKNPRTLMPHNANSLFALMEMGLLGGVPIKLSHLSIAALYGISYVLFSWFMMNRWDRNQPSPQFFYYFFDTTLGWFGSAALVMLLSILVAIHASFSVLSTWFENHAEDQPSTSAAAMVGLLFLVCRFRD